MKCAICSDEYAHFITCYKRVRFAVCDGCGESVGIHMCGISDDDVWEDTHSITQLNEAYHLP